MKRFSLLFILGLLIWPLHLQAAKRLSPEGEIMMDLVVQDGGRLKPLDTYARNLLLGLHTKSSLNGDRAITWLAEVLLHPEKHHSTRLFKLPYPDVLDALGVDHRKDHLYHFEELREGIREVSHDNDLQKWFQKAEEDRTRTEKQLIELYSRLRRYYEASRLFTLFFRDITIDQPELASTFGVEPGQRASYLHFHQYSDTLRKEVERVTQLPAEERGERDQALMALIDSLGKRVHDQSVQAASLIPSPPSVEIETWATPWTLMGKDDSELDPWSTQRLQELENTVDLLKLGKFDEAKKAALAFKEAVKHQETIPLEVHYNQADYFTNSLALYLLSFILLLVTWFWAGPVSLAQSGPSTSKVIRGMAKAIVLSTNGALVIGLLLHGVGIWLRMVIMDRPPVSTLYESIIFVSFVAVLLCFILELVRRDGVGTFCATVIGVSLHFLGFSYADDGDTMGMLVAVLNSNFWLATHVVTITIGYGITIVAGLVGHLYLGRAIFGANSKTLDGIYKNAIGLSLIALLFTTIGTILGGIWADQSWGRFWGWDPKENGALLIVLWLLMLLHGRISGLLKGPGFSAGLIIGNIVVALAWFGVNLLAVGLHSYGFTDSIAMNLGLFCGAELLLAALGYIFAVRKMSTSKTVTSSS